MAPQREYPTSTDIGREKQGMHHKGNRRRV
jgi:hypothetical protein